ncbi:MAG: alpha/beta fold hydrolase, partial [Candidatus Hydrogenedentes bacterium]|nr:alpha/beta fold hydrolase [Candidatus Hydrogenedentota bacterium]
MLLNLLLPALEAGAWPGFTWEQWREITHVERPQATSPQVGQRTLLPLLDPAPGATEKIDTVHAWEMKRARIHTVLNEFVGQPQPMTPPPPSATELGREDAGNYERIHLRIASEADDTIPAYLLLPKERPESRAPVMIVLHQTQAPGKQEACGMTGDENMAFARELAERGMICLAPDAIGFGERIQPSGQPYDNALDLYRKHPQWSYFGKMNWDMARIVDYLETLGYIDPKRIGVIGHSHGAYGSIMAAVAEPRIALVVASCGYTTLRTDPSPNRWSHLTALLPRLGFYVDDV